MKLRLGRLSLALWAGMLLAPGAAMLVGSAHAQAPADAAMQTDVNKLLDKKQLRDVKAQVANGVVTLTGTVQSFADKLEAGKRVGKVHAQSVLNQIQVTGGAEVADDVLGQKLANKLTINGENPGRTPFEYFGVSVKNGVVTLSGFVTQPYDDDYAKNIVADQPGVKDLIDKVQVAPLSPNDDRVRLAEYRAIYGFSSFTKYAINPAKTIRILVLNGNVTLVGVVDNNGDRDLANLRANGVGGVFKVTNNLQVQGQRE